MLWKILSGLSALALGVGAWYGYQTQLALKEEISMSERAKSDLKRVLAETTNATEAKEKKTQELAEAEKLRDDAKTEVIKVTTDIEAKTAETAVVKTTFDDVSKQLAQLEDQISKAGNIKLLMAKVEEETQKKNAADAAVTNKKQQLAILEERLTGLQANITRTQEVEKRQRTGVVEAGFTARVAQAFNEFGFVILNKGNRGGMFANAFLDVKRGSSTVARLKVRDVEQQMSVADLIPGSMQPGQTIRTGDLVVAARMPAPAPVAPTPAPDAGAAQAPAGGAAPMAPAGADPFGAPAAPAPMAPAGADPFAPPAGGAPAPAAPMAPAGADPFAPPAGGAPAAAPAPAPAPAPGGAMAPAGTDPFAPPTPPAPAGGAAPAPAPAPGGAMAPGADPFAPPATMMK